MYNYHVLKLEKNIYVINVCMYTRNAKAFRYIELILLFQLFSDTKRYYKEFIRKHTTTIFHLSSLKS